MRDDLDKTLCATYPEIFRDRYGNMRETAMCWGFSCGDGWYPLIERLCYLLTSELRMCQYDLESAERNYAKLQGSMEDLPEAERKNLESMRTYYTAERIEQCRAAADKAASEIPIATQVKEKFGGLRFYVNGGTQKHHAYIRFAEAMSYRTCEYCGATQDVYQTSGWVHTVCKACATKANLLDRLLVPDDRDE